MSVKKINISGNEYDIKDANAQAMISDEFDSGTSYTTGDYCIYENVLYKFTSDKSAGAWDSGKVASTNIDTELSSLNSSIGKYVLDNVERMRFQITSDNRALLWFYTDSQNENGFRIDFTSSPKQIQFRSVTGGSSEIIGIVQME